MDLSSLFITNGFNVARQRTDVLTKNMSNRENEEHCYEDTLIHTKAIKGIGGVQRSHVIQRVNENMMDRLRGYQSQIGAMDVSNTHYQNIDRFFGDVNSRISFAHTGSEMAQSITTTMTDPTANRGKLIESVKTHLSSVASAHAHVESVRANIATDIVETVEDVNQFLKNVADFNSANLTAEDADFTFLNIRRLELHKTAEKLGLTTKMDGRNVRVMTEDQNYTLVSGDKAATFTAAVTSDNVTLQYDGFGISRDVTDYMSKENKSGSLSGLMRLHETYMPAIMESLDNYALELRDQFNAAHNLGSSFGTRTSITGSIGIPGFSGDDIATAASPNDIALSVDGTLRLATITSDGTTVGHADIDISGATSLGGVIDAINAETANTNIIAALDGDGALTLTSSNGNIAMTSVDGQNAPTLEHDGKTWGFSHFFGLNNLLSSPEHIPGESVSNLAQKLSVRSDILQNENLLCVGKLSTLETMPTSPAKSLLSGEKSVLTSLYTTYAETQTTFSATDIHASKTMSFKSFTSDLIKDHMDWEKSNERMLKAQKFKYEGLSKEASAISKGDPDEAALALSKNAQWYQSLVSAYKILARMDEETFRLI